ncbi:DUF4402 domain-containing protein [Pseudoblastomonas halimionae]|uniref:DUF4402 domain-containing protein n=1 Tax=Alteriqipengyuania halimionae TaxID=1926630 RepID=A0A6I4U6T2_9SPHN|nr:DUF4402 domain-containing protein [Alteriqipengyuania halimionae]MXP11134.1 DUF4402 domain-containing protein [Alteriqipengyuania halimionae]
MLCLFAPQAAQAQSASAEARVTVVRPLTLVKIDDMDFGAIAIGNSGGGQVTLNPATSECSTASSMGLQGQCRAASFAGYGAWLMRVRISVPQRDIVLEGPGDDIIVDALTLNTSPDLWTYRTRNRTASGLILTTDGVFEFRLGGRLNVAGDQAPGRYSGEVVVNIEYQ